MVLAPANRRLSPDLCSLLAGNDLFILAEAVRSLTSAVSLGDDICGPPHATHKRPHASPGFKAKEEGEGGGGGGWTETWSLAHKPGLLETIRLTCWSVESSLIVCLIIAEKRLLDFCLNCWMNQSKSSLKQNVWVWTKKLSKSRWSYPATDDNHEINVKYIYR